MENGRLWLKNQDVPKLYPGEALQWEGNAFLKSLLTGDYCNTRTGFRISENSGHRTIREYESVVLEATFAEFNEWLLGRTLAKNNAFSKLPSFSSGIVSAYADYKHFPDLFAACSPSIPPWGLFSAFVQDYPPLDQSGTSTLPDDASLRNTLWLSSRGAHTPLHYDTYGCNVVVQLSGRKRWLLWKPNGLRQAAGEDLLPATRIPYEESSVYSLLDPLVYCTRRTTETSGGNNDRASLPPVSSATTSSSLHPLPDFEFVLAAGDILFVPKHYWHFVYTESESALSVNQWLPLESDTRDQLEEAVVRLTWGALRSVMETAGLQCDDSSGWCNVIDPVNKPKQQGERSCRVRSNSVNAEVVESAKRGRSGGVDHRVEITAKRLKSEDRNCEEDSDDSRSTSSSESSEHSSFAVDSMMSNTESLRILAEKLAVCLREGKGSTARSNLDLDGRLKRLFGELLQPKHIESCVEAALR